jgi:AraC-like DNA-binding protein
MVVRPTVVYGRRYRSRDPESDLARFVFTYYVVDTDPAATTSDTTEFLMFPCVNMLFTAEGGFVRGVQRHRVRFFDDPVTRSAPRVVVANFLPGGFQAFTGHPVSELIDRTVPFASVFASDEAEERAIAEQLSDPDVCLDLIERFLISRAPSSDSALELITAANGLMSRGGAELSVPAVAAALSVSVRTLQRVFSERVGVSPNGVIRRYRMHRALAALERPGADIVSVALELGYYDQAHFTRDFYEHTGWSPRRYVKVAAARASERRPTSPLPEKRAGAEDQRAGCLSAASSASATNASMVRSPRT